jgi:hypothetical protein
VRHGSIDLKPRYTPANVLLRIQVQEYTTYQSDKYDSRVALSMKAAAVREWGAPLEIVDMPDPKVKVGEVLVRLRATGICYADVGSTIGGPK